MSPFQIFMCIIIFLVIAAVVFLPTKILSKVINFIGDGIQWAVLKVSSLFK